MIYKFNAYGHPNIQAAHKTTLEFTKDENVSLKGDCIVGIKADFELKELENFMKKCKNNKILITISNNKEIKEKILAEINPNFDDDKEFVIRKTNFISKRTFAINSNKVAFDLNRSLISYLKEKENGIVVTIATKP